MKGEITLFNLPQLRYTTSIKYMFIVLFVLLFYNISGKEGITNDKLSKRSTLYALSLGQCMIK
jgi:hypothetical protein